MLSLISSNLARAGHPSRITVSPGTPEGQLTGLKLDSVIMTDNIATVEESQIDRVIGEFTDMASVDAALRHTLGL